MADAQIHVAQPADQVVQPHAGLIVLACAIMGVQDIVEQHVAETAKQNAIQHVNHHVLDVTDLALGIVLEDAHQDAHQDVQLHVDRTVCFHVLEDVIHVLVHAQDARLDATLDALEDVKDVIQNVQVHVGHIVGKIAHLDAE